MNICVFSRSVGAGRATTRKTRGLTRSVMALMVPPLPAPSRPSKTMQILKPSCLTHSWSLTSSTCSLDSSFSYAFRLSRPFPSAPMGPRPPVDPEGTLRVALGGEWKLDYLVHRGGSSFHESTTAAGGRCGSRHGDSPPGLPRCVARDRSRRAHADY